YMYSISTADVLKYMTPEFVPIKELTSDDGSTQWDVQDAAVDGAVDHIKITNAGSGYVNVHSGTCQNGGGADTVVLAAGASAVNDHYNGATIFIESGQNAGQYRVISDYDGATKIAT